MLTNGTPNFGVMPFSVFIMLTSCLRWS